MATLYVWVCFIFAFQFVNSAMIIGSSESQSGMKKCKFFVKPTTVLQNQLFQSQGTVLTKCPPDTGDPKSKCVICETLDYYAVHKKLFECNCTISVVFLEGDHVLNNKSLYINHVRNLEMLPLSPDGAVTISLLDNSSITIKSASILHIERLVFQGSSLHYNDMILEAQKSAKLWKVRLKSISIVFGPNNNNDTVIWKAVQHPRHTYIDISESEFLSSNILFMFEAMPDDRIGVNIHIAHSRFYGQAFDVCSVNMTSFTLVVLNISVESLNAGVSIESLYLPSCSHIKPSMYKDHDVMLEISAQRNQASKIVVSITDSNFSASSEGISAVHVHLYGHMDSSNLTITDCVINGYQEGGLHMSIGTIYMTQLHVTVENVSVTYCKSMSSLSYSSAMSIVGDYIFIESDAIHVSVHNCYFIGNQDLHGDSITLWLYNIKGNVLIEDCTFDSNLGTAIQVCNTDMTFSGNVNFTNNIAYQGGAIKLINAQIYFANANTQVLIQDNHAKDAGGGIFVDRKNRDIFEENRPDTNAQCVYQLPAPLTIHSQNVPLVVLLNNSASNGGDHIYGASLHSCCTVHINPQNDLIVRSYEIEHSMFQLVPDNYSIEHSLVSSNPTRLCFCNEDDPIDCTRKESIYSELKVIPGEEFSVSLAMVGVYFGRTTGQVFSSVVTSDACVDNVPTTPEKVVNTGQCTKIKYTLHVDSIGDDSQVRMILTTSRKNIDFDYSEDVIEESIKHYENNSSQCLPLTLLTTNVYLTINVTKCPLGFKLSDESHMCECNIVCDYSNSSSQRTIASDSCGRADYKCKIKDGQGYINRKKNTWMYTYLNNSQSVMGIVKDCPFDYCKEMDFDLNTNEFSRDLQCQFNRGGVLCGQCVNKSFSLALGSSKCVNNELCRNKPLLIVVFLILGPLLIIFIKTFDLTVRHGTINGLIFYANVVWIYKSIFFPTSKTSNFDFDYFLKVFVAWINLDFGIETCFFTGLDAYVHTWLQFLFPFYIWAIMVIIIIMCHCSARLTKYIGGENSVPVLATLFLLSFVKLLRTISRILHITYLENAPEPADSTSTRLWSVDGNIPYLAEKHAPLFAFAVIMLLFICIPYNSILLFEQCLVKFPQRKIFCWVRKPKPFFDANLGPLKDKHRYWVGLLLLVRSILVVVFATLPTEKTKISLFLLSVTTALLMCYSTINLYENWMVSLLESAFLTNLLLLAMSFLFEFDSDEVEDYLQKWMLRILVGMAFAKFVGIVVFHLNKRLLLTEKIKEIAHLYRNRYRDEHEQEPTNPSQPMTRGEVNISRNSDRLRESLLSSTSQ